jgi:hypothetical protein
VFESSCIASGRVPVSLDCPFLISPLPVSLDCPFLISPSVFSNVYVVAVDFIRLQKSTLVGMLR